MKLTFTKGPGKTDWLDIVRADGSAAPRIECPKQRIIPHDMVHYAVESVMTARGFLGGVAAGGDAGFAAGGDAAAEAVERLVETIQAEAWSAPATTTDVIDLYQVACAARGHAAVPVDAAAIETIRAKMAELDAEWRQVPVGGRMTVRFEG